jgi:hypothetical protein
MIGARPLGSALLENGCPISIQIAVMELPSMQAGGKPAPQRPTSLLCRVRSLAATRERTPLSSRGFGGCCTNHHKQASQPEVTPPQPARFLALLPALGKLFGFHLLCWISCLLSSLPSHCDRWLPERFLHKFGLSSIVISIYTTPSCQLPETRGSGSHQLSTSSSPGPRTNLAAVSNRQRCTPIWMNRSVIDPSILPAPIPR